VGMRPQLRTRQDQGVYADPAVIADDDILPLSAVGRFTTHIVRGDDTQFAAVNEPWLMLPSSDDEQ